MPRLSFSTTWRRCQPGLDNHMSLHIRVFNDFWTHRKTARLRTKLGDDALWIMPRLWSYAAESQPDGDLSDYTSEEIAMLIGCPKHATSIRQAMLDAGFLDEVGTLHNWDTRNGYHAAYSDRAKKAAAARWRGKEKLKGKEIERKGKETSNATSIQQAWGYTLEDCQNAAEGVGLLPDQISDFFTHYAAVDFVDGAGRKITSLKHALAKWKKNQCEHLTKNGKEYQGRDCPPPKPKGELS